MVSLEACLIPSRINLKPNSSVAALARTMTGPRLTIPFLNGCVFLQLLKECWDRIIMEAVMLYVLLAFHTDLRNESNQSLQ